MSEAFFAIFGLSILVLGVVFGVLLFSFKPRRQQDLGPRYAPDGSTPPEGKWNLLTFSPKGVGIMGGTLGATTGTVEIIQGIMTFTPNGAMAPTWSFPCGHLAVRAKGVFNIGTLQIWTPMGEFKGTVSQEHINMFSRNTAKDFREASYAKEFAEVAWANGARPY